MHRVWLTRHVIRQMNRFKPTDTTERCGLIFEDESSGDCVFVEVDNMHSNAARHFAIRLGDFLHHKAKHHDKKLRAVFHTHLPSGDVGPSEHDKDAIGRIRGLVGMSDVVGVVLHVGTRTVTIYDDEGNTQSHQLPIRRNVR